MEIPKTRRCPECGRHNRVPTDKLALRGNCGACKATLPPLRRPVDVDAETFRAIVGTAQVPVLVDFWAPWCAPCRRAAPAVQEVARRLAGHAMVLKVNTEEQPQLASMFSVRSIPHFAVLKHGDVVSQQSGLANAATMERWLRDAA